MNTFVKKTLTHAAVAIALLVITALYFYPQLEGKAIKQSDIQQYLGMSQEVREFKEKTGENSLWTNAMFGGMPTYQINTIQDGNNLRFIDRLLTLGIGEPIGRFFAAMICFYILMMVLGAHPLLGAVGAVAFGFSTNNFILYEAGHITKLTAISFLPLIAAGMLLTFRKQYLVGGLLFALGIGLDVYANHVQMTYYFALTLLIFGVAQLIDSIQKGELLHFAKAAAILLIAGGIGIASAASNLLTTYEYSQDTMRGKPILQPEAKPANTQSSSEVEGLAWDYAMQWSNGTLDLFASFIPGVVGGGSQEPVGENSTFRQELIRRGYRVPANLSAPLYWGKLPFTSGPAYFGATVVFFFLLGLILVKGPVKWWLGLGVLLTLLLSMGKHLEGFNRIMFDYFPLYNKFRTPNSILSVTAFLVPMLGLLALREVFKKDADPRQMRFAVYVAGGIAGGVALFFWLLGPSFFDFTTASDQQFVQNYNISPDALPSDRKALMRSDAFRSLVLVLLSAGLIWAYLQKWLQHSLVIAAIGVLVAFDLWTVGARYLNSESFEPRSSVEAAFKPREVDELIKKDSDPHFRVFDLSENTFNSSFTSYFHKSIGGYHAAKLQRYQDLIDRHLAKNNERVLNMLNTKYFIIPGQGGRMEAQINMAALGNAWFVDTLRMVQTPNQEIDALNNFDPAREAIVHQEFADYLAGLQLQRDSAANIKLTAYKPNRLTYQSNAAHEQFAVFSEIWYGPNKGWQAYIDGKPVEHIRVNYLLRAMRVPAGQHQIEFVFDPKSYKTGKAISMVFSSVVLLGLLGITGFYGYQAYQNAQRLPKPTPPAEKEKPAPRTAAPKTNAPRPATKPKKRKK